MPLDPSAPITVSAFKWVPPFAQGVVRDLRVRWALEEAGLAYAEQLIQLGEHKQADYRRLQPFGQVPVYREGPLELFESGAIVLHIAEKSAALLPAEPVARARAKAWMFAALNSVEPWMWPLIDIDIFSVDAPGNAERRPGVIKLIEDKLQGVADWLGDREWLEDRFTAGDLLMVTVLRILRHTDIVAGHPTLAAYQARGEARPAFRQALADQMAPFARYAPPE